MKQIAFLFPGQGSQKIGMGKDVFQAFESARKVFLLAEELTGLPIRTLCFDGPEEALSATIHLQPAITAVNLALLVSVLESGIHPTICAGHSLGEYSALAAAKIISIEDCIHLVQKRGELMHRESILNQGAMHAIVGLDIDRVSSIVTSAAPYGPISIANHNSADQVVITGGTTAISCAAKKALKQGGSVFPLKVNGAWHSPMINGALAEFENFLSMIPFGKPACKMLYNVTATQENHPDKIKTLMSRQLCSPVQWFETMRGMMDEGVDVYVEIGPGKVLARLLKKTLPKPINCRIYNIFDVPTLTRFLEAETIS